MTAPGETQLRSRLTDLVADEQPPDLLRVRVRREIRARQRMRRFTLVAAGAAAIILALVAVVRLSPGPKKGTVTVVSSPSSTTTVATTTTELEATTTTVRTEASTTTTAPAETTVPTVPPVESEVPASDSAPVCIDSSDASCGPLSWIDGPPVNAPIQVSIDPGELHVKANELATFHVQITDDAQIETVFPLWDGCNVGTPDSACLGTPLQLMRVDEFHFGSWHAPVPFADGSSQTTTLTHVFDTPGTHTLGVEVRTTTRAWTGVVDGTLESDPYTSFSVSTFTVIVDP